MKKLTKILIIVLSVALLCGAFVLGASANVDVPEATTHISFVVYDADDNVVTTNAIEGETEEGDPVIGYVKLSDAFANVPSNGTILLVSNYEDGPNTDTTTLGADKQNVTLDLNYYTLSASCSAKTSGGTEEYSWQEISVYGSLTVTGEGYIETATSAFIVMGGGSLTFDAGEYNTISLVAKCGYNLNTNDIPARKFPGNNFIKINEADKTNVAPATVNVRGNLDFTDETEAGNVNLFAYSDSSVLNIENATITSTNYGNSSGLIKNHFTGTYDKDAYDAPVITVKNSVIDAPYGTFFDANNKATDYSDAVSLTVNNSVLNLYGEEFPTLYDGYASGVVSASNNNPAKIVVTNTKIHTDSNFYAGKAENAVPKVTIQLKDCEIDIDTGTDTSKNYFYSRYLFRGIATALVEDTALIHDGTASIDGIVRHTHAWGTKDQAEAAGYTDPGYFTDLGMGILFKRGTAFVACRSDALITPVTPGTYAPSAFEGYAYESGTELIANQWTWLNGAPIQTNLVTSVADKITKHQYITVETATVGAYTNGTEVVGGSFGDVGTSSIANRNGKYTICEYGGNKYLTHQSIVQGTHQHKSDPCLYFGGSADYKITKYRFYSYELDFASAAINYSQGRFALKICFYFGSSSNVEYMEADFTTDARGSRWTLQDANSTKNYVVEGAPIADPGEWQHVQFIIEAPVANGAFDTANPTNFKLHLYIDGKPVAQSIPVSEISTKLADKLAATAPSDVYVGQMRLSLPTAYNANDKGATAYDNLYISTYPITYTDGKTNDADILATVVNNKYALPENLPLVEVEDKSYSDLEAACATLGWDAQDGHVTTLKYLMDVSSILVFDPREYAYDETSRFKFVTFGEPPALADGCGYIAEPVEGEANTYLVRPVTDADKATVNWYDADGALVKTDKIMAGESFAVIPTNTEDVVEKYYTVVYKWAIDDKVIESDTISVMGDTDIHLVPTFKATFDDLYINAKLLDNLTLQLFLPKDFIDASSRIEKVEGKDTQVGYAIMVGGNKANTQTDMANIGGKAYNSFVKYANYAAIITEWTIVIEYTVEFNGEDYKLSREFEATSLLEYCEYILTAVDEEEKPVYSDLEKSHVANLIRFANEYTMISRENHTYDAVLNAAYEEYKSFCTAYNKDLLTGTPDTDITKLQDYIKDIGLEYNGARIRFVVTLKDGSKVTNVQFLNVSGSPLMTYTPDNIMADGIQQNKSSSPYYSIYRTASNRIFTGNYFGTLTIKLTVEDVGVVEGTYDLKTWYNGALKTEEEKEMWAKVLNSLYSLSHTLGKYWNEEIPKE